MSGDVPEDVLALARRAHEAFPTVPVLGVDIVRDAATGALSVLEVNVTGGCFHLTSIAVGRIQREHGIDTRRQFGGAAAVARGIHQRIQQGGF